MGNWLERLRPRSASDWVVAVGFAGAMGFTGVSLATVTMYESLGMSRFLAKNIALLGFYLQVVSHGIAAAGFVSGVVLSIGRNVRETVELVSSAIQQSREKEHK